MNSFVINNVKVVTPYEVLENGFIYIRKGIIDVIEHTSHQKLHRSCTVINGQGRWLFPGIVDMFNTALEKELETPFAAVSNRLVSNGITTVYHALSSSSGSPERIGVNKNSPVRHNINLVHDIGDQQSFPVLEALISRRELQLVSIVTNGVASLTNRDRRQQRSEFARISDFIELIAEKARKYEIRIAACEEGSVPRIAHMKKLGIKILEFPRGPEAAAEAAQDGMFLLFGAPDLLQNDRGHPVHMLCSDGLPSSMLNAAFFLYGEQHMNMAEVFKKLSLNPAAALGIDKRLGSIECGKLADLVLVREVDGKPLVEKVFINGLKVYGDDNDVE